MHDPAPESFTDPSTTSGRAESEQIPGARSRADHRRRILGDLDAVHGLLVASLAALCSGGLLYLVYLIGCWRTARGAGIGLSERTADGAGRVCSRMLLFGKHTADGLPDADFSLRIARVAELLRHDPTLHVMLLGGGPPPTEAQVAHRALLAAGVPASTCFEFEQESRDTLQNLRHARGLLGADPQPVALVSNRYHLPRCALFAGYLGIPHLPCAAEERWRASPSNLAKLALEAAYCMWVDIGRRWARLIGHRRMLGKVS